MTPEQEAALRALCRKTGETVETGLTQHQADCRIDVLKHLDSLPCRKG